MENMEGLRHYNFYLVFLSLIKLSSPKDFLLWSSGFRVQNEFPCLVLRLQTLLSPVILSVYQSSVFGHLTLAHKVKLGHHTNPVSSLY